MITNFQAYDSVWRPALFAKLKQVGFGGKTLQLIQSMYRNDSVSFLINGHFSPQLWLSQGVKQGNNRKYSVEKRIIFPF